MSHSKVTRSAVIIAALGSLSKPKWGCTRMDDCEILFQLFDECMSKGYSSCDSFLKRNEKCRDYKRDPGAPSLSQMRKKSVESLQREATAKGFASIREYHKHLNETNPGMCRVTFELYKECIGRGISSCEGFRNKCPQFK